MTSEVEPKRTQILKAFYETVKAVPPPGGVWRRTERAPLLRVSPPECPAFYVFDFQEQIIEESKQSNEICRCALFVILEVFVTHTLSDNPSDVLNKILAPIQQAFLGNRLGNLVQVVSEVGSKFKVESLEQRQVSAEVAFRMTYFRGRTG